MPGQPRLAKLGLGNVEQLLGYYPRSYEDRTKISTIAAAPEDQPVCVEAFVAEMPRCPTSARAWSWSG